MLVCFMALVVSKHIEQKAGISIRSFLTHCKQITDARLLNKVTKREFRMRAKVPAYLQKLSKKSSHRTKTDKSRNKSLPDLTLKDMNGKPLNVSEYGKNGKLTVICFWATWCKPCIKELSNIAEHYEEWTKNYNLQLLAVSVDDAKTTLRVPSIVKSKKWKFDILLDPNEELMRSLGVSSSPFSLLADKIGNIIYEHEGYVEGDEFALEE